MQSKNISCRIESVTVVVQKKYVVFLVMSYVCPKGDVQFKQNGFPIPPLGRRCRTSGSVFKNWSSQRADFDSHQDCSFDILYLTQDILYKNDKSLRTARSAFRSFYNSRKIKNKKKGWQPVQSLWSRFSTKLVGIFISHFLNHEKSKLPLASRLLYLATTKFSDFVRERISDNY